MNKSANTKFIIFGYGDYIINALNDVVDDPNVWYCNYRPLKDYEPWELCIRKLSTRMDWGKLFFSPIKSYWFNRYYPVKNLGRNEKIVFIFYEINEMTKNINFINMLKKKYKNSRFVLILTNVVGKVNIDLVNLIHQNPLLYNMVISFNMADVRKYGLTFHEWPYSTIDLPNNQEEESDIYFCGFMKNRIPLIFNLYKKFSGQGLKCNFNIIGVPESEKFQADGIHYYDKALTNITMLKGIAKSKCVLDISVDSSHEGCNLRVFEAIAYQKKLLTNNIHITSKPFYNPNQISLYRDENDINLEFIQKELPPANLINILEFSPRRFLSFIEQKNYGIK